MEKNKLIDRLEEILAFSFGISQLENDDEYDKTDNKKMKLNSKIAADIIVEELIIRDDRIKKLENALREILEIKQEVEKNPELLLSHHDSKEIHDSCAVAMDRYEQSFIKAKLVLEKE
jgi:hypothetical protein